MPNIQKVQDALVDMAKDLLMLDLVPLLEGLDAADKIGTATLPVRFASREKTEAFRRMVVAFHAARGASEDFRKAHVAELQRERAEWEPTGLSREDIESRRAS